MSLPFVGEQRARAVAQLVARFDEVTTPGSLPQLVMLEAPVGWGKTRIVHEFYAALASRQPEPAYWPATIAGAAKGEPDPQTARKLSYPQVPDVPAGAVPHWFWWGLTATQRQAGATPVQALAQDLTQLQRHAPALERRWRQVTGRTERVKDVARRRGGDLLDTVGSETFSATAGFGLEQLLNATVPGLGLLWWAGQRGWERHVQARPVDGPVDAVDEHRPELVALLAEQVTRFAASGIPVVIAIEDVHAADASLVDLLHELLTRQASPILIVATAWPGLLAQPQRPARQLLRRTPAGQLTRLTSEQLGGLEPREAKTLIDVLAPEATAEDRWQLAERFTNPQALQLALGLARIRRAIVRGRLRAELSSTPTEVLDLYREMWKELPAAVRQALALAVLSTPTSIGTLFESRAWDVELTVQSASSLPWLDHDPAELHRDLEDAAQTYAWVAPVDTWLRICQELDQHHIAREAAHDLLAGDEREEYHQRLAEQIELSDALPHSRQRSRAQLLVALAAEGVIDWTPTAVAAADLLIDQAAAGSDTDSLTTLLRIAAAAPPPLDATARLRRDAEVASALGRLGRHQEASAAYDQLLEAQRAHLEPDDPALLVTRVHRIRYAGYAGDPAAAAAELSDLLVEQEGLLGRDDPACLATRHLIGHFEGQAGRPQAAVARYLPLAADRRRLLGEHHPDTLRTRNNLGRYLGRCGWYDRAIGELSDLLATEVEALGADHPQTLTTRSNLAHFIGLSGDHSRAIDAYAELVSERQRLLGRDHPKTLIARANLARFRGEAGDHQTALAELTALLADRRRVLGDEHPRTLLTRTLLGRFRGESGELEGAIEALTELLADQQRLLGDDHPHTLTTRQHLARFRCESGDHDRALSELDALLADRVEALGAEHLHVLTTRQLQAACLAAAGDHATAIDRLTDLLADQQRLLGDNHASLTRTRSLLAASEAAQASDR